MGLPNKAVLLGDCISLALALFVFFGFLYGCLGTARDSVHWLERATIASPIPCHFISHESKHAFWPLTYCHTAYICMYYHMRPHPLQPPPHLECHLALITTLMAIIHSPVASSWQRDTPPALSWSSENTQPGIRYMHPRFSRRGFQPFRSSRDPPWLKREL